jgi:hypothetical protein
MYKKYIKYKYKYLNIKNILDGGGGESHTQFKIKIIDILPLYIDYMKKINKLLSDLAEIFELRYSYDMSDTKYLENIQLTQDYVYETKVPNAEEKKKLNLLGTLCYIMTSCYTDLHLILFKYIYNEIDTYYDLDTIIENYKKYKIIILRNPIKEELLIGCGTQPLDQKFSKHEHFKYTTINVELSMNPDIIAAFGVDINLCEYFNNLSYKFTNIYGECVSLIRTDNLEYIYNDLIDTFNSILIPDFKIINLYNGEIIDPHESIIYTTTREKIFYSDFNMN